MADNGNSQRASESEEPGVVWARVAFVRNRISDNGGAPTPSIHQARNISVELGRAGSSRPSQHQSFGDGWIAVAGCWCRTASSRSARPARCCLGGGVGGGFLGVGSVVDA